MNTETVKSLSQFVKAVAEVISAKGDNKRALARAGEAIESAIYTEQDLRNPEFTHEVNEFRKIARETDKPVAKADMEPRVEVKKPVPAASSGTKVSADVSSKTF